jgi:outer membrane protein assembly factor BamB
MKMTSLKSPSLLLLLSSTLLVSGCSWLGLEKDKKPPLQGERVSVLELQKSLVATDTTLKAEGFVAPSPWKNDFWTQAGGYPNHNMQNVSLSPSALKKIWSEDIGAGASDEFPLTAQPVIFNGIVYTMDSKSNITAFDTTKGKTIWENSIRPKHEDEDVIGGGLAVTANMLYATNGYGELIAINPTKGGIFWRTQLTAPSRAAPTVLGDKIYVLTLDNHLSAFDAATGKQLWKYEGLSETASLIYAASPAIDNEMIMAPMSSGELTAIHAENGSAAWSDSLSPSLQTGGASSLPDIAALPAIDKGRVFAISYGGKFVSIDITSGQRVWTHDVGGAKSPWVSGNMVFFISSNAELVALGRDTGALAWVMPLATYDKEGASQNSLLWNGPVMAGDRLILTSADESLLEISPKDGTLIRKTDLGFHVAVPPVVAGETLYLVSTDGTLSAWK